MIPVIDYANHSMFRQQAMDALLTYPWCALVREMPLDNQSLVKVGEHCVPKRDAFIDHAIPFDIKVSEETPTAATGSPIQSQMPDTLPLHTDGYDYGIPPALVYMQCIVPSATGGDSVIITVDDVVTLMSDVDLSALTDDVFPTSEAFPGRNPYFTGSQSILDKRSDGFRIRFNLDQIKAAEERDHGSMEKRHEAALSNLSRSIGDASVVFHKRMTKGECLICNNYRVLHGRSGVGNDLSRVLRRVRFYDDPFDGDGVF